MRLDFAAGEECFFVLRIEVFAAIRARPARLAGHVAAAAFAVGAEVVGFGGWVGVAHADRDDRGWAVFMPTD